MIYLTPEAETDADRWAAAWEDADIPYESLSYEELFERVPGLAISLARHAFQLPDRSMRTDLLLHRVAETAENIGVEIRSGCFVSRLLYKGNSVQGVELSTGETISARLVILAGNAKGGALQAGFGTQATGVDAELGLSDRNDAWLEPYGPRKSLEAMLAVKKSDLQQTERDLAKTVIASPFDCRLGKVEIEAGQYLTAGQSLFEVYGTAVTEVEIQVPLDQLRDLIHPQRVFPVPFKMDAETV